MDETVSESKPMLKRHFNLSNISIGHIKTQGVILLLEKLRMAFLLEGDGAYETETKIENSY